MNYCHNSGSKGRAGLVLSMLILLGGCATLTDPGPVAVAPNLPDLPDRMVRGCYDPGVDQDAIVALTENRVALATCRRLQRDTVAVYNGLKRDLSGQPQ